MRSKNEQRIKAMRKLIKKTIILLIIGVCFRCLAHAGFITDRAGVGDVSNPADLQVQGRVTCSSFTMITNPALNYVLTSNSQGNGTWQPSVGSILLDSTNTWSAPNTWNMTGTFPNLNISGNVGISTGTPSYKLDVYGFVRSTAGFICPDGSTITTLGNFVPYKNATQYVNLGSWGIGASSGTFSSNVIIGSTYTSTTYPETLKVDQGASSSVNVISGYGNTNNYIQLNIKNQNSGGNASSDLVATADNGNESTNYIDMGINSSGYNNGSYNIGGPDDGYLFTAGNNLDIGTANWGYSLKFHTGGTLAANERMRIDTNGNVGIGTQSPFCALHVVGNSLVTGPAWGTNGFAYMFLGDTNTYISSGFGVGVTIQAQGSPSAITIAQYGVGTGFGVPNANVNEMLSVAGRISLSSTTAPSNTAGYGMISKNSSDKELYYQDENGNKTQLSYNYAFFEDQKSNTSSGGDGTAGGWYARVLSSTTLSRGISITRSGNTFTLQPGTYRVVASAPFYGVNRCKIRLRNTSDTTTAIFGTSEYTYNDLFETGLRISRSWIDGIVTVSSAKTFQIEYYISTHNSGGEDLGVAASSGDTEVYTKVYVEKIN